MSDRMIRDAYSIVAQPDRLMDLLTALQADAPEGVSLADLGGHFEQAIELMDQVDPTVGEEFRAFVAKSEEDNGGMPEAASLEIDQHFRVLSAETALLESLDLQIGSILPKWVFAIDPEAARKLREALGNTEESRSHLVRLRLSRADDVGALFIAHSQEDAGDQARRIRFRSIRLHWDERTGQMFADVLRLTPVEAQLAEYIVNGLSVRQFAQARNRSLGTARNQLKALLKKLGLSSQVELVSLYGGFHTSVVASEVSARRSEDSVRGGSINLPDGRAFTYEDHGEASGTPLVYLHATADGAYFTPGQRAAARANKFRVIAPWLPFYAGNNYAKPGIEVIDAFCEDVIALMDEMGIERCPLIAVRASTPYGFALLSRHPERFTAFVLAGMVVPLRTRADVAALAMGYRAPMRLARISPSFVKLYFAAAASMVKRGDGMRFFRSIYGNSEADLASLANPDVVEAMRRSLKRTFEDGYSATLQQTLVSSEDYSAMLSPGPQCPVALICGEEDGLAAPDRQSAFAAEHGFEFVGPVANAGSLVMHQVPRLVFDTARRLHDNA